MRIGNHNAWHAKSCLKPSQMSAGVLAYTASVIDHILRLLDLYDCVQLPEIRRGH
jgi:hypothetical protein